MTLRRGFKAHANAISRDARKRLKLALHAPLDPFGLSKKERVPVVLLSTLRATLGNHVHHLMAVEPSAFSACTVHHGDHRTIVVNDAHSPARQASNLAHELAHLLLEHPAQKLFDDLGCRHVDRNAEAEADWLGPALLVSDEAAIHIAQLRLTIGDAADRYGVSEEVMRFRMNVTAAYKRVA
jgi:Zn-dependent peptidase ImmA (M78 family)